MQRGEGKIPTTTTTIILTMPETDALATTTTKPTSFVKGIRSRCESDARRMVGSRQSRFPHSTACHGTVVIEHHPFLISQTKSR